LRRVAASPVAAPVFFDKGTAAMEMTRSSLVRCQAAHKRLVTAGTLVALGKTTEIALDRGLTMVATRPTRARLGMLGVPLAIVAALMSGQWWALLPLALCSWWWSPSSWGWEWLAATGRGLIATEWALLGAGSLAAFPGQRLTVGAAWVMLPVVLAACSTRGKR
jgi:hypothetical protein